MMIKKRRFYLGVLLLIICSFYVIAVPQGPTVSYMGNTTKNTTGPTSINYSTSSISGGYIFTMNLNSNQQNLRWKAYVGNVTGTLVLQDASGYSVYDWPITTALSGEVYATRASSVVTWSSIACATNANVIAEEAALNHTINPNDNISKTFDASDNDELVVGTTTIAASTCNTTNLYVNGTAPVADSFEEALLHDGTNMVYTSILEQDAYGYNGNLSNKYDFQMIVPEIGLPTWTSSIAYYFYVELS